MENKSKKQQKFFGKGKKQGKRACKGNKQAKGISKEEAAAFTSKGLKENAGMVGKPIFVNFLNNMIDNNYDQARKDLQQIVDLKMQEKIAKAVKENADSSTKNQQN